MHPVIKKDYVTQAKDIINHYGYQNCIIGSKVTGFVLDEWIFLIGGVTSERVRDHLGTR